MALHNRKFLIRRLTFLLVVLALLGIVLATARAWRADEATEKRIPEPVAPPLDYSSFPAGRLISDEEFTDWQSLTEEQIQAFLDDWGYGCRPGGTEEKPVACLKDYRTYLGSQPANRYCPRALNGGNDLSVAEVISRVARSCQINPKVILVTLQKEQSLITASSFRLTPRKYEIAMGYGCPDHKQCDTRFYGIDKQIYYAAQQWRRYRVNPKSYQFQANQQAKIKYGPSEQCGSQLVYIENWATAALYNYTPYVPGNEAKLGLFDECNQSGNLNFYAFYQAWFGDDNKQPITREKALQKKTKQKSD